jgi:PAS domain S-box-containing protein
MKDEEKTKGQLIEELKLLRRREEYRNIFVNAIVGIYRTSPEGRFLTANPTAARLLGYESPEELISSITDINTQIYANPGDRDEALRLMREQGFIKDFEVECRRKDGSIVWGSLNVRIVRDEKGEILYHEGTSQDITDRKRAEEELLKTRDELELRVRKRTADLERVNDQLRSIPSKLIEAQEDERRRIAGELHNSIGQTLAALKYGIETVLVKRDRGDLAGAFDLLERFVPTLQHSIEDTRSIYRGLRPPILDNLGVLATLEWFCREFQSVHPNLHLALKTGIEEEEISGALKITVFRIVQEALNNVAKHSGANRADLSVTKIRDYIELVVQDDGKGFDLNSTIAQDSGKSLGLAVMKERVEITGGIFCIESVPDKGTILRAVWPG